MPSWLATFDLDTLVRDAAGEASEADRAALARAARAGVTIAFASARRATSAAAIVRALSLDGWVLGCDGAHIARARDDRLLSRHTLPATVAARITETMSRHGLEVFAITVDGVHGPPHAETLARETLGLVADAYLPGAPRLADVSALVGVGDGDAARALIPPFTVLAPTRIAPAAYELGSRGAIRVNALRSSRARAAFDLAARLGIRKTRIVYAGGTGDGWFDASGLRQIGRVLCSSGVPREVAPAAERLSAEPGRGVIAEVLERTVFARDGRTA